MMLMKQWNLVVDLTITDQRNGHGSFSTFFTKEDDRLCVCHDIKGLFK